MYFLILTLLSIALDSLTEIVIADYGLAAVENTSTFTLIGWFSLLNVLSIDLPSLKQISCGMHTFTFLAHLLVMSIIH